MGQETNSELLKLYQSLHRQNNVLLITKRSDLYPDCRSDSSPPYVVSPTSTSDIGTNGTESKAYRHMQRIFSRGMALTIIICGPAGVTQDGDHYILLDESLPTCDVLADITSVASVSIDMDMYTEDDSQGASTIDICLVTDDRRGVLHREMDDITTAMHISGVIVDPSRYLPTEDGRVIDGASPEDSLFVYTGHPATFLNTYEHIFSDNHSDESTLAWFVDPTRANNQGNWRLTVIVNAPGSADEDDEHQIRLDRHILTCDILSDIQTAGIRRHKDIIFITTQVGESDLATQVNAHNDPSTRTRMMVIDRDEYVSMEYSGANYLMPPHMSLISVLNNQAGGGAGDLIDFNNIGQLGRLIGLQMYPAPPAR